MEYNSKIKLNENCLIYIRDKLESRHLSKELLKINWIYNCNLIDINSPYITIFFSHIGEDVHFNFLKEEFEIIEDKLPVKEENNTIITIEKIEQILNDNFDRDDIQDIIKCLRDNLFKEVVKDQTWIEKQLAEQRQLFTNHISYHSKSYKITDNAMGNYFINP